MVDVVIGMASKRAIRRRSCERKRRFVTREAAHEANQRLRGLAPYPCQFCHGWHLGHGRHLERAEMKAKRQQGAI